MAHLQQGRAMTEPLGAGAPELVEDRESRVERVRGELADVDRRLRHFVRERPLTAVLGAVIAGYVVARATRWL
jgi:hypothetical protein